MGFHVPAGSEQYESAQRGSVAKSHNVTHQVAQSCFDLRLGFTPSEHVVR